MSELISQLQDINPELAILFQQQTTTIERLTLVNEQLEAKVQWFEEQYRLARHKQYGAKSERTVPEQPSLFNEAEAVVEATPPPEEDTITISYERKRKPGRRPIPENLPIEKIEYRLPEEEQICTVCGGPMHEMGSQSRQEINFIPAQVKIVEHVKYKYSCRDCEKNGTEVPIKTAEAPRPVIEKGLASPSALAYVMTRKYVEGMPLYRMERHFERMGIELKRATLSNWMIRGSEWLELIYDSLKKNLVALEILHADETALQVLNEAGRPAESKSYMWLYRSGRDGPPIVLFEYQMTRGGEHSRRFLEGFRGYLHVDGYAGYHDIPSVTLAGCWSHARRKFDEALKGVPPGKRTSTRAREGMDWINALFAIERDVKDCSPQERLVVRDQRSRTVVDNFRKWLDEMAGVVLPKSLLGTAVNYCRQQWPKLMRFLEDGRLEISNNMAERSIRPFVIGRKNWLFSNTPKGAKASAIIYSIVETAKENGLDPHAYLNFLFEKLPNLKTIDEESLKPLMPWAVRV